MAKKNKTETNSILGQLSLFDLLGLVGSYR